MPHYTNFYKHVRLGDIVVSTCNDDGNIYYYSEKILVDKDKKRHFKVKSWKPTDFILQRVYEKIMDRHQRKPEKAPWDKYIHEGLDLLKNQESDYNRPPAETDRLYMGIGDDNVIEVQHPEQPDEDNSRQPGHPVIHSGIVGSGRTTKTDETRMEFASVYDIRCFDSEFDQVLASIDGNRKESFMLIRGIADYADGSKNKEWQPYASLVAAAMAKTIIKAMNNPHLSEDEDY